MKNILKYILGGLLVGTIAVAATNRVWESQEWLSGQITTPSNPSAGKFKFYFKSDGEMYKLNSAGVEEQVGGGGSAAEVTFASSGTLVASNVQDALQELDGDIVAHLGDATDAHDASAISNVGAGGISSTDVQAAINELDTEKAPKLDPTLNGNVTIASLTASRAVVSDGSSVLTSSATTATELGYVNGVTRAIQTQLNEKAEGRNILLNPNFELSTNWTASGGATSTINSTAVGTGTQGYDWDSNSASQTLSSDSVTIPNGMKGRNGVVSCAIKTVSGSATHTLQAYDGTNILASTSITSDTGAFARTSLNFVFPTSGSAVLRLVSVASNEPEIYIDDCYMGLAEGFNIGSISQFGDWTPYTPTFTGFGTVTVQNFKYRTAPNGVEIEGRWTLGTTTATEARVSLPNVCAASASDYVTLESAGFGIIQINGRSLAPLIEPSVSYLTFGGIEASIPAIQKRNGNDLGSSGLVASIRAFVRCQGFSSNTVYRPEVNSAYYSGYHDSTCLWTRTNTAYGDFTADASCALVTRSSNGISAAATGSVLPALALTLPRTGLYYVCGSPGVGGGAASQAHGVQLYDGTNALAEAFEVGGNQTNVALCGILNATTLTPTVTIRGKSASGSVSINAYSATSAVEWTVFPLTGNYPAPVLVGSVTVPSSTTGFKYFGANVGGTGTVNIDFGDGINGNCTNANPAVCTFTTSFWTTAPVCTVSVAGMGSNSCWCGLDSDATTSSVSIKCNTDSGSSCGAGDNFNLMCLGY